MRNETIPRTVHCVICSAAVPEDRVGRNAVTCTPEHAKIRKAQTRLLEDERNCRYCRRPSSPEKRGEWLRWYNLRRRAGVLQPEIEALLPVLAEMQDVSRRERGTFQFPNLTAMLRMLDAAAIPPPVHGYVRPIVAPSATLSEDEPLTTEDDTADEPAAEPEEAHVG